MPLSRLIARPMLSAGFLVGGINALRNTEALAPRAANVTEKVVPIARRNGVPLPEDPATLVRLNASVQVAAALALATGRAPRLSSAVLAATLVPTTAAGHRFWEASDPQERNAHLLHFAKNVSMIGGLLIASGDTEGKPGLAWRTRRAAKDAKREARHIAQAARREAKLAKARAT